LNDRQTRKPSAHTMKAYRQDFIAIATLVTDDPSRLAIAEITKDSMRAAFAAYVRDHEAVSIRRCWSTWNVLCTFLYTSEQLAANPMQFGRPSQTDSASPQGPPPRCSCSTAGNRCAGRGSEASNRLG
jgi:integrase/recombinase XerC